MSECPNSSAIRPMPAPASRRWVADDLDGVHLLRPLNMEEQSVFEIDQGVSPQHAEANVS
jgi:hypothetical protein